MEIKYLCPYWGQEGVDAVTFIGKVLKAGYQGIEINPPVSAAFTADLLDEVEIIHKTDRSFVVVAQQWLPPANENVDEYIARMLKRLHEISVLQPAFINSHTGKDFFSFDDNCRVIEAAMNFSSKTGIKVIHETHRGRFAFHLATLLPYLQKFLEIELAADYSHFCVVSESLLEDQEHLLEQLTPHIAHLHARVGFSQSAQVNDPMAPEWAATLQRYTKWWQAIVDYKKKQGLNLFTIAPEFGPVPYMPVLPFTQQPIGNQWGINVRMKEYLSGVFS